MSFVKKLAALAATAVFALPAITAWAAQGDVQDIAFRDLDHNGRIERALITIANPDGKAFTVTDVSRLKIWYGDKALAPTSAYVTTSGDPAKLVVLWDQNDPNLPIDTGTEKLSIEWPDFHVTKETHKTDLAAPMLVGSTPMAGALRYGRNKDVTLTFSESIDPAKFAWTSVQDASGWSTVWSADGRTATLSHSRYSASAHVSFTATQATDLAGNAVVAGGAYLNPFKFTIGTTDTSSTDVDPVFSINEPVALTTLMVNRPSVIAWYANQSDVAQVQIRWSVDGGSSYRTIGTYPVTRGSVLWYPPNDPGNFSLKLEGLNANGALVAVDIRNPISLTGEVGQPDQGTEEFAPALPASETASPNDKTAPKLVGSVIIDQMNSFERSARVSWVTDELSTGSVIYGTLKDYGLTGANMAFATAHSLTLTNLTPGVIHNLRLTTLDGSGNAASTEDIFFAFYKDGDLVKASGAAVYWIHDGKRDVFPNAQIYATWFKDFSAVIRIGDEQLAAIQLGTNVKVKGGSTLVKITSDPKTYAVEPDGTLRWIQTEAQAQTLYGTDWNKKIIDIDVSLFVNYKIGDPLADGQKPAGWIPL